MATKEKAEAIVRWFRDKRRTDDLEPNWVHPGEQAAQEYLDNGSGSDEYLDMIFDTLQVPDHTVIDAGMFGLRVVEDAFKVGTTSWIFVGRKTSPIAKIIGKWVIYSRTYHAPASGIKPKELQKQIDGQTVYAAFHNDEQMGYSAMTGSEIGPSLSMDIIEGYIDEWDGTKPRMTNTIIIPPSIISYKKRKRQSR